MPHLLPRGGKQQPTATSAGNFEPRAQPGLAPASHNLFLAKVQGTASIGATFLSGSQQEELQRDEFTKRFSSSNGCTCSAVSCSFTLSARGKRGAPLRTAVATELPSHCCRVRASHSLLTGRLTAPTHRPNGARGAQVPVISQ